MWIYFEVTKQETGNWCFRWGWGGVGSRYCGLTRDDVDIVIIIQAGNKFHYFFVFTFYRVLESDKGLT